MMATDDLLIASLIRYAITQWLERHDTSPLTGLHLDSKRLTPNKEVRAAVAMELEGAIKAIKGHRAGRPSLRA